MAVSWQVHPKARFYWHVPTTKAASMKGSTLRTMVMFLLPVFGDIGTILNPLIVSFTSIKNNEQLVGFLVPNLKTTLTETEILLKSYCIRSVTNKRQWNLRA